MMITLRKITSENCFAICDLKANENFVATNTKSLIQAYAYSVEMGYGPLAYGIYKEEMPVGFIMADYTKYEEGFNNGKPFYFLWRMMVDENHQNKGYGRIALTALLDEIKTFPLGEADTMFTSVVPGNEHATRLYESLGFHKTGEVEDGEELMELVF